MEESIESEYYISYLWALLFSIIFISIVIIQSWSYWKKENSISIQKDVELLDTLRDHLKEANLTMVLFGNSRLRYGLDLGFYPDQFINLPDGRTLAAVQYGIDIASFDTFKHLMQKTLAIKPDYIVIVRNLLTNNSRSRGGKKRPFYETISQAVFAYLYKGVLHNIQSNESWQISRRGVDKSCLSMFSKEELYSRLEFIERVYSHDIDGLESLKMREYIDKALNLNIKIIIVELPSNTRKITEYGVKPHRLSYPGLGYYPSSSSILHENYDRVRWLEYSEPIGESDYCDYTHLNFNGRKLFTKWFLEML